MSEKVIDGVALEGVEKATRDATAGRGAGAETFAEALLAGVEDATSALANSEAVEIEEFVECLLEIGHGEYRQEVGADGSLTVYSRVPDTEALMYVIDLAMGPVPTQDEMMSRERPAGLVRMPDTLRSKVTVRLIQTRAGMNPPPLEQGAGTGNGLEERRS